LLVAVLLGALAGCAGGEKTYDVSGTVTFNGHEVPMGMVYFDPDGTQGVGGSGGFATIVDGKFSTTPDGRIRAGAHTVRVLGFDGKVRNERPYGDALFPEYTTKHDQPKQNATLEIEVPATHP